MKQSIGIIGGSGPDATELLYHNIITQAREKYNATRLENYPDLIIASVPILQDVNNDEELKQVVDMLCSAADRLKAAGVKQLCFACNTHHLSLNLVKNHVGLPFISMVDLVSKEVQINNYTKVAVIGTSYTLGNALYAEPLNKLVVE